MEDDSLSQVAEGRITNIRFSIATQEEICTSSISDAPISHPNQLTNPFLGLPLASGKCESCGTAEPGKCEGHFGYIEFPAQIYHPCHITELKKLLNLICLNCLRLKRSKNFGNDKASISPCSFCEKFPRILINDYKTNDGVVLLELKLAGRSPPPAGFWNFLDRFGYRYGNGKSRILLPCEALEILKRFSEDTRKKLGSKGYFPQDGYILEKLPVPPNCLSIPDISDGVSIMSSDISVSMLRKVLNKANEIKGSRSGRPNFESHKVEVIGLQELVAQYLRARGTSKDSRDIKMRSGFPKEADESATKAWLEKMRTFFVSKGSGYCSRSVITGDAYKKVNEIGLPLEVAQKITFEEKVTQGNKDYLQDLVDKKMCLTYRDGASTYSLREGSKGHTFLKVGQVVHRRVMDGDLVFVNRPPSTHKHSLQALSVYVHEDHTVKINPLICGPLDADFDGDCVHLFYPQSLAARAEVLELFSVEQQLLSSHSGSLNLQLKNDSLLSLKTMFKKFFLDKVTSDQLAMFMPRSLPHPALVKDNSVPQWTVLQILEAALPEHFDCSGERYLISRGKMLKVDFNRDILQPLFSDIITSVLFEKGPKEALQVFNSLQPLLMEYLFMEGYSVSLEDFSIHFPILEDIAKNIQDISPLLHHLRCTYNELVESQVGNYLRTVKAPVVNFILKSSGLGDLIDSKSESAINKVVEQIGFLGLQLVDRGKFYSRNLVEDMTLLYLHKYAVNGVDYPSEAFGLIKSCFFHGLNPYENLVHSISSREVLVRSSRGLTEPGTLFKNLMTMLRDVVVCYDGTVRNVCNNSVIQFEYGGGEGRDSLAYPAGEPVGALSATAISNPSYKAVLDSSSSSNTSWELMKEILVCKVNFVKDLNDRRVILYLNDCDCGKLHCKERAAYAIQNQMKKVSLRDISDCFLIEYQKETSSGSLGANSSLVGHIHLNMKRLKDLGRSMHEVLLKCQETISLLRRAKKNRLDSLKNIFLSVSECCCFQQSCDSQSYEAPCLQFSWRLDTSGPTLELTSQIMANVICPILLNTFIKGDSRVCSANIIWISPDSSTWVKNYSRTDRGELALEIVLEKICVKHHGDAWRLAMDACLPVMHLIDTRRSIPYAIRQLQEILGISCAFDQAVGRLSTSIRMVNKGVQKKHLILAVSSMTCTGSLIGFNKSGYRTLFRSLNVQIPFTEATLFTPRKCFERAAEKCHTDTLSGIVASSAWGKHVAVGSGTRFEILWNKKEMGSEHKGVIDVYNFLQLVRASPCGESNTSCLGEEYDYLEVYDRVGDQSFSPEQNFDCSKPTFDDAELQPNFEQHETVDNGSSWEKASAVKSNGDGAGWGAIAEEASADGWNIAATKKSPSRDTVDVWGKPNVESDTWGNKDSNSWNATELKQSSSQEPLDAWGNQRKQSDTWGNKEVAKSNGWNTTNPQESVSKDPVDARGKQVKEPVDSWGNKYEAKSSGWNATKPQKSSSQEPLDAWGQQTKGPETWGDKGVAKSSNWNMTDAQGSTSKDAVDAWGQQTEGSDTRGNKEAKSSDWDMTDAQGSASMDPVDDWRHQTKGSDTWGNKEVAKSSDWNMTDAQGSVSKGKPSIESETRGNKDEAKSVSWEKQTTESNNWSNKAVEAKSSSWAQSEGRNPSSSSLARDSPSARKVVQSQDTWGNTETKSSGGWGQSESELQPTSAHGWKSPVPQELPSKEPIDSWGKQTIVSDTRENTTMEAKASSWTQREQASPSTSSVAWDSPSATTVKKGGQSRDNWGKAEESNPSDGWGKIETKNEPSSLGWSSQSTNNEQTQDTWGKSADGAKSSGGWSQTQTTTLSSWNSQGTNNDQTQDTWGKSADGAKSSGGWSQSQPTTSWNSQNAAWTKNGENQEDQDKPWGRGRGGRGRGRGRGRDSTGSRGWGDSSDWKQSSHPADSPGNWSTRGALIQYTPEEQNILSEVEPIMQCIKKILHQSGYNDDDRLKPDDESYILENVFKYHPDKSAKIGLGIDHVTISKHTKFQGTRCLYMVSTDGRKEDFSYRKCLENFVKEKYPELAAGFVGKYWKPKNSPGESPGKFDSWNRGAPIQYTSEEQNILSDVEPIMQCTKKIMHQSGYNDDDRLKPEDESYILENVFQHHPDKTAKMGLGVDHVMISKHTEFQGTRCLYIVSTDGRKEDFSYRKCLESYIKEKYPELAAGFVEKYFGKKTRGRDAPPQEEAVVSKASPASEAATQ